MAEKLFGLGLLDDFCRLLIWTGQIKEERPASAIIVAPPGAGKTTMLQNLRCETAIFVGDLTARPLGAILRRKNLTHVLLGDMLSIFGHKKSTVDLTVRLISQMTAESIGHNPWSGEEQEERSLGLLTAIPPSDFQRRKVQSALNEGGFASRFMVLRYSYRPSTIAAIHRFIRENRYAEPKTTGFAVPSEAWTIAIDPELGKAIEAFAQVLRIDPLGFRSHRHVRVLVKASARRQGRKQAIDKDLELVKGYCDFFTREGKEL